MAHDPLHSTPLAIARSELDTTGSLILPDAVPSTEVEALTADFASRVGDGYSVRGALGRSGTVRETAERWSSIVSALLDANAVPTKATYFDKTPDSNWLVPWHQDLTITVEAPQEHLPGFAHWRQKHDLWHVQPPLPLLEQTLAVRLHLDPCPASNGALRVIPGSHRSGILDDAAIARFAEAETPTTLDVQRGDAIVMRPLLLHSSPRSAVPHHRRVLHLEFCTQDLPAGLAWGG